MIKAGTTSHLELIYVTDDAGNPKTGLAYHTPGLSAYYVRNNGTATPITLAAVPPGNWISGGFVAVDNTNMPGIYQIGVPNAALATGASSVVIQFKGVEDCVFTPLRIELYTELDVNAVKIGGTTQTGRDLGNALPAAAPGSNGGLPTTNGTKLNQAVDLTEGQTIACSDKTGFSLTPAYDAAKTAAQAGDAMSLVTGAITSSKIAAGALSGKGDWSTIAPDNASTAAILAVVQCDKVAILVDGVYWISYRVAGTATEIMRKQMLDANGEPVASITTPVAALRGAD